jgi:2-C-methyl-D-erythritol 4-phosphate cytidylyltransferase
MELSAIVALPATLAENRAAAFAPLAGEPPLARAVRTMLGTADAPDRLEVVVAAAAPLVDDVRAVVSAHGLADVAVIAAERTASRAQCIESALKHIGRQGISNHVLVHDYRRPLASITVRDRVVTGLRGGDSAVMPALPLTDSVKAVDAQGVILCTVDRSTLRTVQYPRGFTTDQLLQLIARRATEEFDEFSEAVANGLAVTLVEGDPDGFVADLPADAAFVEAIIARRPVAGR